MLIHGITTEPDNTFPNPIDIKMEPSFSPPEDKFPAYFLLPDKTILNYGPYNNQRLYFNEQAADYTPLPSDSEPYTFFDEERYVLPEFARKTNQQLQNDYQMSFGGSILPSDAVDAAGITGGKIATWRGENLNVPVCVDFAKEVRTEAINGCITAAGDNKVAGPLPNYTHPVQNFVTSTENSYLGGSLIKIFPNPGIERVKISTELADYNIKIYQPDGSIIQSLDHMNGISEIDVSKWNTGVYFIWVFDHSIDRSRVWRFIKSN